MRGLKKRRIVSIAEFSFHPIGTGTSVGKYVKQALQVIVPTILKAVEASHSALRSMGAKRISSILRIDARLDKPRMMKDKIEIVDDC